MVEVNNHDVAGLYSRINRFIEELIKSVSSGTSQVNAFDATRIKSYLNAIEVYTDWVLAQPQLDLPETHPRKIVLAESPAVSQVENESLNDLIRLFEILRDEIVNSQSARDGAGLNKFDSERLKSIVEKAKNFISSYVEGVSPLDLPESSPVRAGSGPGRTGI